MISDNITNNTIRSVVKKCLNYIDILYTIISKDMKIKMN